MHASETTAGPAEPDHHTEAYYVVFADVVNYSKRSPLIQESVVLAFSELVKATTKELDLEAITKYLPTGDGAAICFLQNQLSPKILIDYLAALTSAIQHFNDEALSAESEEVKTAFLSKLWSDKVNTFALRIGVDVGYLFVYPDLNDHKNLAGTAINNAARLLSLSMPSQVVFSERAAKTVEESSVSNVGFQPVWPKEIKGVTYSGRQLVGLEAIRSTSVHAEFDERPSNDGLDDLPHLWLKTNHSKSNINWVAVEEQEWAKVVDITRQYYTNHIREPREIASPTHTQGSDVYKVEDRDAHVHPIFLKLFRAPRPDDQLEKLFAIHRLIADSSIFSEEHSECLRPLTTVNGLDWVRQEPSLNLKGPLVAFRFLTEATKGEVTHFKGASETEIESVGYKLGLINDAMIGSDLKPMIPRQFPWNDALWDEVIERVGEDTPIVNRALYLAKAEKELIESTNKEIRHLKAHRREFPMTLHDFHPHNVFVSGDECILVVDFEGARTDWPEEGSYVFALHRLCREYIRRIVRGSSGLLPADVARPAAEAFLNGYKQKRPEVVKDISRISFQWAKAINFAKLMNNIAYEMTNLVEDSAKRSEEEHYREVIKFISYLKELDVLEQAIIH